MNYAIKSDDPQAVEKLQAKLGKYEETQAFMKQVNAYFRKHETTQGCPGVSEEQAAKMDAAVQNGYSWEKLPFPPYHLSNNNAEIRRLKQRITQLSQERELGFVGWDFPGGTAQANTDMNRLQLFFDEKPDEQRRSALKSNGFKWAPSVGAWQRHINANAIYAASRMEFVRPESGVNPVSLQPKASKQNEPER